MNIERKKFKESLENGRTFSSLIGYSGVSNQFVKISMHQTQKKSAAAARLY